MASGTVESSSQGSNPEQQQQQQQGISRSKLVQRLLATSANLPAFINDLLTTQAVVVAGTEAAGFLLERAESGFGLKPIAHIRPDNSDADTRQAAMEQIATVLTRDVPFVSLSLGEQVLLVDPDLRGLELDAQARFNFDKTWFDR